MGRLLDKLLAESEVAPAANPANPANLGPATPRKFADSQDSQGVEVQNDKPAGCCDRCGCPTWHELAGYWACSRCSPRPEGFMGRSVVLNGGNWREGFAPPDDDPET